MSTLENFDAHTPMMQQYLKLKAQHPDYEISQMGAAVDFTNDKELSEMLIEVAKTVPGINKIRPDGNFGGSEDISVLGKRVQAHGGKAAFFICGADRAAGHHQGSFDVDEGAFKQAFDMYVGMAKKLNG